MSDANEEERVKSRWQEIGQEVKRAPGYTDEMEDLQGLFNLSAVPLTHESAAARFTGRIGQPIQPGESPVQP